MALISKAANGRGVGKAAAAPDGASRPIQPAQHQIAVGARSKLVAELPCQGEPVKAGFPLQIFGLHGPRAMCVEILARPIHGPDMGCRNGPRRGPVQRQQNLGDLDHDFIGLQRFQRPLHIAKRRMKDPQQGRVIAHGHGDEGQVLCTVPQSIANPGRFEIEHAIKEPFLGSRLAVMALVGMQDHGVPRQAGGARAAVMEGLDAVERDPQRIAIMAMAVECMASEMRLDPFQSLLGGRRSDPVPRRRGAGSFKTGIVKGGHSWRDWLQRVDMNDIIFDTKIAIVLRDDLAAWQKLNVAAFLTGGLVGGAPQIIGEPYRDAAGHIYSRLPIQPLIILACDGAMLSVIHRRALEKQVQVALYIEEMFRTNHDAANRAVFAQFGPDDARPVGLALRAERKLVDKITRGARMHA